MSAWYYARGGQQNGPVSTDEIIRLFGTGSISPGDLVWREGMVDWKPAGEIPELSPQPPSAPPPVSAVTGSSSGAFDPYRPPVTAWNDLPAPQPVGDEIVPGSQPLDIGLIISRSWELTKRHLGTLVAVGVIYVLLSVAVGFVLDLPLWAMQSGQTQTQIEHPSAEVRGYQILANLVSHVFDIFLGLGIVRIGLNMVSGKPAEIGMLFGEGRKLLTTVFATLLYGLLVFVGLLLLIVPGIYLALRFGQYQMAIVDKDLGVIESLKYSAQITQGNVLNLFGLGIVCLLIVIAGFLALVVGLIVAIPVAYLASFVAYRWLQYGRASIPGMR